MISSTPHEVLTASHLRVAFPDRSFIMIQFKITQAESDIVAVPTISLQDLSFESEPGGTFAIPRDFLVGTEETKITERLSN